MLLGHALKEGVGKVLKTREKVGAIGIIVLVIVSSGAVGMTTLEVRDLQAQVSALETEVSSLQEMSRESMEVADAAWETADDVDTQVQGMRISLGALMRWRYDESEDGADHCLSHCDISRKWMGMKALEHIKCRESCYKKHGDVDE